MEKPLVVAITGASGSIYGLRLVQAVTELGQPITLTISHAAGLVIHEELGIEIDVKNSSCVSKLFSPESASLISYYPEHEMTAPIASGSYPTKGMVIVPTSTTCFAKVANGISESLIERAAECMIKEGRKLVVVPRETPMSAIHLENLLKLARVGVKVVPAIPAFYSTPSPLPLPLSTTKMSDPSSGGKEGEDKGQGVAPKADELIDFVIGKILDQLEIPHMLYRRWTGSERKTNAGREAHG